MVLSTMFGSEMDSDGAEHAEFKLVAREGKGRGAVAVGGILREAWAGHARRCFMTARSRRRRRACRVSMASRMSVSSSPRNMETMAGGRFVGAETVVVAGGGHGDAQQILIFVHGLDDRRRGRAGTARSRPACRRASGGLRRVSVEMDQLLCLPRAVDAGKGLFVQQADQTVPLRRPSASSPWSAGCGRRRCWSW